MLTLINLHSSVFPRIMACTRFNGEFDVHHTESTATTLTQRNDKQADVTTGGVWAGDF